MTQRTANRATNSAGRPAGGAAKVIAPVIDAFAPGLALRLELWDGTSAGTADGPTVRIRSADALRRLLWAPGELGVGRAYLTGDIDIDGDIFSALAALRPAGSQLRVGPRQLGALLGATRRAGALGRPLPPPPEEARPRACCTPGPGTRRPSAITTTSATTSTGSCWDRR